MHSIIQYINRTLNFRDFCDAEELFLYDNVSTGLFIATCPAKKHLEDFPGYIGHGDPWCRSKGKSLVFDMNSTNKMGQCVSCPWSGGVVELYNESISYVDNIVHTYNIWGSISQLSRKHNISIEDIAAWDRARNILDNERADKAKRDYIADLKKKINEAEAI